MSKESETSFSLIVPTLDAGSQMAALLESLNAQDFERVELILVDAGSRDRTLDIVKRGYAGPVKIYSVASYNLFEMLNRGASLATHDYVAILLPSDSYISPNTLSHMAQLIQEEGKPDLAYCGCLIRERDLEPRVLMRPLSVDWLKRGKVPTSLQSCFWRSDVFRRLGKFNASYRLRGGYDLLCRFAKAGLRSAMTHRVFVDHDRTHLGAWLQLRRSIETQQIIGSHFGFKARLRWMLAEHPMDFVSLWWAALRNLSV